MTEALVIVEVEPEIAPTEPVEEEETETIQVEPPPKFVEPPLASFYKIPLG